MKKFFIIICAVVGVFTVAALAASAIAISYLNRDPDIVIPPPAENGPGPVQNGPRQTPTPRPTLEPGETIPRFTNVLVVGVDDHGLTDIVMAMVFNRDTGAVNLLNIPRDTAAVFSPGLADTMRANGLNLRHDNILRINQIRNYGRAHGMQFLQQYLEELFGVSFHFRVEVNMQAFHRLVDAVEGVWIDVTFHMHYVQGGEIDIIAKNGERIHFIEVKMRQTDKFGTGREAVTPAKQKTIRRLATRWLVEKDLYDIAPVSLDVIEISGDGIEYFDNCF